MFRVKYLIAGVVALCGLSTLGVSFSGLGSYVKTAAKDAKNKLDQNLSVDFQIKRAKTILTELDPEIRRNQTLVVNAENGITSAQNQIADMESRLATEKERILREKTDIASKKPVVYNGTRYTPEQIEADLAGRFQRYKIMDSTCNQLRSMLAARQKNVNMANASLQTMLAKRDQLKVEIESLEARYAMVDAMKTSTGVQMNEGEFGRLKELMDSLKTRVTVDERLLNPEAGNGIAVPTTHQTDTAAEVDEYFAKK